MDEYIKREDAIKHLRGACIAKYPLSFSYGIFASADEISKLPTADVAPKSEVAEEIIGEVRKALLNMVLANAMVETYDLEKFFAELKKKYTEEK